MELDSLLIKNTVRLFFQGQYDNPLPIPYFHEEMWNLCSSKAKQVAIAAPRGTAKSTAITHAYVLCSVLFRVKQHVLIVSDTESQAASFLGDIKVELTENEDVIREFMIARLVKDSETELIVECTDKHRFRILAKGSEQKVRGLKWRKMRPDLIVGDDLENDEIVLNSDRREKFRRWFFNALLQCGNDDMHVRIVGTILHLDSMLNRLLSNKEWKTAKYAAHGKDFTNLLWPEKYSVEKLKGIRNTFKEDGNLEGYSQEYLNEPVAEGETYYRDQDFIPMDHLDHELNKTYFAAADFAISESERADYTVIVVAGMDSKGVLHIEDTRRGRWDADEIINELISVQRRYNPEIFTFETEKIDKAIGPSLNREMLRTGQILNIKKVTPTKSKTTRGRSMQKIMRAGGVRFNERADWYEDMKAELMMMAPGGSRGLHDDYFDAFSLIGLTIDLYYEAQTFEELEDEQYEDEYEESGLSRQGASKWTGY